MYFAVGDRRLHLALIGVYLDRVTDGHFDPSTKTMSAGPELGFLSANNETEAPDDVCKVN